MPNTQDIRNVALISHASAGKTSLGEAILFNAGATTRHGKVEEGNTVSDYNKDEVERKISIHTSVLHAQFQNKRINIVDTPGYADFVGDLLSSLIAVDCAIVVVNATGGVEVGTEKAWKLLDQRNLPRLIYISKLDKENTNFPKIVDTIKERLGKRCAPLMYPVGKETSFKGVINLVTMQGVDSLSDDDKQNAQRCREGLIEAVAEGDDTLLEKYLEGGELSDDELKNGLKTAVLKGTLVPLYCGSSISGIGVKEIMEGIVRYLPAPNERPPKNGKDADGQEVSRKSDPNEPFSAQVLKTVFDPYVGQLTIFRVFSGKLSANSSFYNVSKSMKERIGQIYYIQGKEQQPVEAVQAGDIAAVTKLKETETGDSLAEEKTPIKFDEIIFPEPAISRSVKPKTRSDEEKISTALQKMSSEDPTFKITRDTQTKEMIASGVGDLHITTMINRLKDRFNVSVELGTPKVAYKETVRKSSKVQAKYKKQSGGRGQYGDVWIEIEPLERNGGFEFVDEIVGGAIPRNYIPSVEKGVKQAMGEGIIAGYPLIDVKVTLYDGSYHEVDSSDIAFQIAGAMALRKAARDATPVLLEPIMDVEITVPDEFTGQITGDINGRRGRVMGMGLQLVQAQIPLSEMFKYATELRSMTGGRGSYSMKFSHYEEVPAKIAQTIIAQTQTAKEAASK
jgi:elongation factor G